MIRPKGSMRKNLIDLFFYQLGREMKAPAEVILTGAAAGSLMGNVRQSIDIDFEIRPKKKADPEYALYLQNLIEKIASRFGIATNYSEDINRWSMIDYLDYRKTATPYKKMGKLNVRIMAPEYW